jgi:hypothetical protein
MRETKGKGSKLSGKNDKETGTGSGRLRSLQSQREPEFQKC